MLLHVLTVKGAGVQQAYVCRESVIDRVAAGESTRELLADRGPHGLEFRNGDELDTDIWDRGAFRNYLHLHTKEDGSDLGSTLAYIFQILNTPIAARANNLDDDLAAFTYINGDLFDVMQGFENRFVPILC